MRLKFGPTTPLVGGGFSENFDLGCVEKLLCRRALGSPPLGLDAVPVSEVICDESEGDTCAGGDRGRKCGLQANIQNTTRQYG